MKGKGEPFGKFAAANAKNNADDPELTINANFLPIFFIMVLISRYCFKSRFTSGTDVPDPTAMRLRRRAFRIFGLRRSLGVMEKIMAC